MEECLKGSLWHVLSRVFDLLFPMLKKQGLVSKYRCRQEPWLSACLRRVVFLEKWQDLLFGSIQHNKLMCFFWHRIS